MENFEESTCRFGGKFDAFFKKSFFELTDLCLAISDRLGTLPAQERSSDALKNQNHRQAHEKGHISCKPSPTEGRSVAYPGQGSQPAPVLFWNHVRIWHVRNILPPKVP